MQYLLNSPAGERARPPPAPMPSAPPAGLHACNSPKVGYADFCATWPPQSDADKVSPSTVASIRKAVRTHLSHFPSGVQPGQLSELMRRPCMQRHCLHIFLEHGNLYAAAPAEMAPCERNASQGASALRSPYCSEELRRKQPGVTIPDWWSSGAFPHITGEHANAPPRGALSRCLTTCAPAQQNGTLQRVSTSPRVAASESVATTITYLRGCDYRARSGYCTEPTDGCTPTGSSRPRLSSSSVPVRLRSTSATIASAVRSLCGRRRRTSKPRSFRTSTGSSCLHETPISACGTQAVRLRTRGQVTRILRRCANRSQALRSARLRNTAVATLVVQALARLRKSRSNARCADASSALSANRARRSQHRRLHRRGTSGLRPPSSEEACSD